MELRPYQEKAVNMIRQSFGRGNKRVLLHLATGAGKTVVFSYILKSLAEKGRRGIMVVRGRELVDQAAKRLDGAGVIMSGRDNISNNIQICSIDTLISRNHFPDAHLIVIDEAHLATSPKYKEFLEHYPKAFILSVTATPYTKAGLRHLADDVICPITMTELIEQGYLSPPRYYAPAKPDLSKVKIKSNGEFDENDLSREMSKALIVGRALDNWLEHGEDRQTILFAPTVAVSKLLASEFSSRGVAAVHIDADTPDKDRKEILRDYTDKKTRILCNVGILTTGVDLPETSCIVLYRPTRSLNLYIQQVGRGSRIFPNKKDFLVFDHGDCTAMHGFVTDNFAPVLDKKKSSIKMEAPVKTCKICYAVVHAAQATCHCGNEFEVAKKTGPSIVDGKLKEIKPYERWIVVGNSIKKKALNKGYKKGYVFYQMKEKFGEATANKFMKEFMRDFTTPSLSTKFLSPYQNPVVVQRGKIIQVRHKMGTDIYPMDSLDRQTLSELQNLMDNSSRSK